MDELITYANVNKPQRFVIGDGIADYNWAVLYWCITSKEYISPEEALFKSGLLPFYKNKKEVK